MRKRRVLFASLAALVLITGVIFLLPITNSHGNLFDHFRRGFDEKRRAFDQRRREWEEQRRADEQARRAPRTSTPQNPPLTAPATPPQATNS